MVVAIPATAEIIKGDVQKAELFEHLRELLLGGDDFTAVLLCYFADNLIIKAKSE